MKSMMISDMEKKDLSQSSILDDRPQYPYGLCLSLDSDSVAKLGLSEMPQAGDSMMVLAKVMVSAVKMSNNKGDEKKYSLELQVTEMDLKSHGEEKESHDVADSMYGKG